MWEIDGCENKKREIEIIRSVKIIIRNNLVYKI